MSDERSPAVDVDRDWSGLEVLGIDECRRLLGSHAVGRIAFVDAGSPVILPVNYTMDGHAVVFRTAHGSKLSAAMMQRPVAFEVDDWDAMSHTGWSVLAKGIADEVLDEAEVERRAALPVRPWSRPDLRDNWVRIMVEDLTGRRITP
jgi:nitroimidazol reductase NimA-like FMN-containing flavoprotein (pyridoxamine 5'-phosphate oxidase superfamily)